MATLCPSPVFVSDIEQESLLQSAFPGIEVEKLAQEDRFLDRIAYVCQKMKVRSPPSHWTGKSTLLEFILHYSLKLPSVDSTSNNFHRGEEFRKTYAELGTIREYFGTTVPWLLSSAMLPQHVKDEVLSSIKIKN